MLRLLASYGSTVFKDDHVLITRAKFENRGDVLISTTRRMVAVARLLTSPQAGISDEMVEQREQGRLTDVASRARDLVSAAPDDVDQRLFEIETLAASGDDAGAADRVRELEMLAPADPEVVGWRQALESPTESTPTEATVAADELAEDLFGGSDLSFETRSKFNSRYADATVQWQGRVKKVDERSDRATQVVVTVATVGNDLYGNTDVDVVIENPSGQLPAEGDTVAISGKLTRIDPLMRNLFVEQGMVG